jgi:SAM-dependent methyltransferase
MTGKRLVLAAPVALLLLVSLNVVGQDNQDRQKSKFFNDTFVATPDEVTQKMCELAKVNKDTVVYDLGCGEAHMLILAAKKYGCKCVGVELNADRANKARKAVKDAGLEKLIEIRTGDALRVKDIDRADVILMYMFPGFLNYVKPIAEKEMKPGCRIVTHDYKWETPGWEPEVAIDDFKGPNRTHRIYMWTVKERKGKGGS